MTTVVAVDCMGGDHGPSVTLVACRQFLDRHPDAELLFGGLARGIGCIQSPARSRRGCIRGGRYG